MQFLFSLFLLLANLYGRSPQNKPVFYNGTQGLNQGGKVTHNGGQIERGVSRNPSIVVNTEDLIYAPPH